MLAHVSVARCTVAGKFPVFERKTAREISDLEILHRGTVSIILFSQVCLLCCGSVAQYKLEMYEK